jgi:hypothetical protein
MLLGSGRYGSTRRMEFPVKLCGRSTSAILLLSSHIISCSPKHKDLGTYLTAALSSRLQFNAPERCQCETCPTETQEAKTAEKIERIRRWSLMRANIWSKTNRWPLVSALEQIQRMPNCGGGKAQVTGCTPRSVPCCLQARVPMRHVPFRHTSQPRQFPSPTATCFVARPP